MASSDPNDIPSSDLNDSVGIERTAKPFLIGIAGGTASGKSSVCAKIIDQLKHIDSDGQKVVIISQDSFYRDLNEEEKKKANKGEFNFDHPDTRRQWLKVDHVKYKEDYQCKRVMFSKNKDAFDYGRMLQALTDLSTSKSTLIPKYNYISCSREEGDLLEQPDVIFAEGILTFYFKEIRDMFHMKLFVDTDADTRLARRVARDVQERGRDLENILNQYTTLVKPAFEEFCLPTKKYADVIIPRGADNTVAIDLIVQHIHELLRPSKHQFFSVPDISDTLYEFH